MPYLDTLMKKKAIKLFWDKTGKKSEIIELKNKRKYHVEIFKIRGNYRVDLFEDRLAVAIENTSNESFIKAVDTSSSLEEQALEWASHILTKNMAVCDICKDKRITQKMTRFYKGLDEYKNFKKLCKKCMSDIANKKMEEYRKEREEEHKTKKIELDKVPPIIIGGFKKKLTAFKAIQKIKMPDRIDFEDGFVYVKGVLKANDNTYYPAFFTITTPGGEHWDTHFLTSNLDEEISQDFIMYYIGKTDVEIFPYEYETLAHIEEDFHQKTWFGTISQRTIRHHFLNQITLARPEKWEEIEDTVRVEVRSYFSIQHILSASYFLKQLFEFERNLTQENTDEELINHRSLVVSIIMSCASFLEATINELFMDSVENPNGIVKDLNKSTIKMFSKMWKKGIPRTASYSIIEKYQIALALSNKKEFDLGAMMAQDVSLLIKLRNALVHFEPESVVTKSLIESSTIKRQKLEQQLKGKFKLNQYTGIDNPFFPDKCLSLDCAIWAIRSSLCFTDEFFMKLEIFPTYQRIKYKINEVLEHCQ